jgi:hypothetical protein
MLYTEALKRYEEFDDGQKAPYYQAYQQLYCGLLYPLGERQPGRSMSDFFVPL